MCYLGTWIRGRLPRTGMAAAMIEVAPGLDIEPLTDVALKHTRLQAGDPRGRAPVRLPRVPRPLDRGGAVGERRGARGARRLARGGDAAEDARLDARLAARPPARVPDQPQQARLDGAARRVAVRARDAARVLRDPRGQRGREGRAHQGRRLPHDRRHRPRVPHRRGVRRARGRPRRRPRRWRLVG